MQAALLTQCCAKFAGLNIRTKNHCVLRGPTWKMTKNRKNCHISFNLLSNDLVTQNNFNKLKAFCNNSYNCRILFPQHWILKSLLKFIELLGFCDGFPCSILWSSTTVACPAWKMPRNLQFSFQFLSNPFQNTWSLKMEHLKGKLQQFLHIADISFAERWI